MLVLSAAGHVCPAADAFPPPATRPAGGLRAVTFNIRNADADDGPDAWPLRRERFVRMVRKLDADVMGFQEVLARQQDDLVASLPEYDSVFVGRDDGKRAGEGSPVFFRKDRFDLREHGTFWLAPAPDRVAAKGWDAALPRICTWTLLHDRTADRDVVVASTHFDHVGVAARANSATLIVDRLSAVAAGRPVLLMGDLNTTEDTAAYAAFVPAAAPDAPNDGPPARPTTAPAAVAWVDAYRTTHPSRSPDEATFHAFRGGTRASRIDYIFCSPALTPTAAGIDRDRSPEGRFPSDHYPVWANFAWATR